MLMFWLYQCVYSIIVPAAYINHRVSFKYGVANVGYIIGCMQYLLAKMSASQK
jgi:hypothetical protein